MPARMANITGVGTKVCSDCPVLQFLPSKQSYKTNMTDDKDPHITHVNQKQKLKEEKMLKWSIFTILTGLL